MALTLGDIVDALGGELHGSASQRVEALAPLQAAGPHQLSFLSHPRYRQQLEASRAGCVIVGPSMAELAQRRGACIVSDDPYLYFARVTQLWRRRFISVRPAGVHAQAVIEPGAWVHPTAYVGPFCLVEAGARIDAGTVLKSRVTVGRDCTVGSGCILHSGVVIGSDGFGFANSEEGWVKIEQLGAVRIGRDVEIGANTCVDRGALQDTIIDDGVKLDNLIQIGHNVYIGSHSALAGCVGVAGSARIGSHCTLGGGAIVLGHLEIADHVHISAASVVTRSIRRPGNYTGIFPLDDNAAWERNAASLKQLGGLRDRLRALEQFHKNQERR
ncbi:MAG: UDP-3-O-(3-hydroxymyristoyl)glucosamine N-acyltransferase [Rhodoferax sp.]|nr:UDP-3-O-(3-hydroxymyristoyl)glucosamine N-acyltransferase [Rhodoferax sp.]